MYRRHFLSLVAGLVFAIALLGPGPGARAGSLEEKAQQYIEDLSGQAIKSLTAKGLTRDERIKRFRTMFKERFAVRGIGKWILGRYWKKATPKERKDYLKLFEDLMVISYVDRFATYAGEQLQTTKTLPNNKTTVTVYTEIAQPDAGPPVRVDWRVGVKGDILKVVDVVVEGTSMSSTLRSDFGSIIRREGGSIAGLIKALREKTTSLRKQL
ncbi:MAG TPA: ABC transporter substrate-binding protein [Rhodospirillales bacterium]|nr:ABC transporter substrate-binding protein [Rhodospirillales bacterium]